MPEIPGRDEQILQSIIDGTEYNKKPKSRIEALLLELKEVIEEGGGVSDYEALENLPQINSVTLIGNKTLSDLGIVNPMVIKGRVDTVADLDNIPNPQSGWVYFVGTSGATELEEYVYVESGETYDEYSIELGYPNYGETSSAPPQSLFGDNAILPTPARRITISHMHLPSGRITFTPDANFEGVFLNNTEITYTGDTLTPGDGYVYQLDYDGTGGMFGGTTLTKLGQAETHRVGMACAPTDENGSFAVTVTDNDYAILSEPASTAVITRDQSVVSYHISFTPSVNFSGFTENGNAVQLTGDTIVPGDGRIYRLDYDGTDHIITAYGDDYVVGQNFVQMLDSTYSPTRISGCAWTPTKVVVGSWQFLGYNTIVIDSSLSTTSENPVQNKVITGALDGLVSYDSTNAKLKKTVGGVTSDVMAVDTTPTANSKNPVTSGAVNAGLALKADLSIFTPISESAYEALQTYTNPLYFIYEDTV